jgi:hypothetical protein
LTYKSTTAKLRLMLEATALQDALGVLTRQARARGMTDTQWAVRAGVRKETLSRLRRRRSCDFETLRLLGQAVGARVGVLEIQVPDSTPDGHLPVSVDRDYEEKLVDLCASRDLDPARWAGAGPRFFMAGLAVMMASTGDADRRGLLALADWLHPGASEVAVFNQWLHRSPVRPERFLPLIDARLEHAA